MQRIVTGFEASGRSVIVGDVPPIEHSSFGMVLWEMWATSRVPADLAERGEATAFLGAEPPLGGVIFRVVSLPPDDEGLDELRTHAEQTGAEHPWLDPDQYGMHRTDTVDYVTVLSGEVWLRLDDGMEVRLTPGDCVIQRGTMHAWRNKSSAPCVLSGVLVSARPA